MASTRSDAPAPARAAWVVWGLTLAATVAYGVLGLLWHEAGLSEVLALGVAAIGFATIGFLVITRTGGNTIGWVLSWFAVSGSVGALAGVYAAHGLDVTPLTGAVATAWLARFAFAAAFVPLPLLFLLFPDGQPPSRRWRPVLWLVILGGTVALLGWALTPGPLAGGFAEFIHRPDNPLSLPATWKGGIDTVTEVAGLAVGAGLLLSLLSLVIRFRGSTGDERQQIRWVAYASALFLFFLLASIVTSLIGAMVGVDLEHFPVENALVFGGVLSLLFGVPIACALAILRYRLYDLDLVIRKAVVVTVMALGLTAGTALLVVAVPFVVVGAGSTVDTSGIAIGLALGLLFWPLRRWARRVADRVVYGRRATPYEVLTQFSGRVGETYATNDILARMAEVLAGGTGGESASIWLKVGGTMLPAATWPAGENPPAALPQDATEVRHRGDILGALSVRMPASDPMNPARIKLVEDLASQAGLVLRNVHLIEDLKASRQRLVAAQDEERRKLERNIHDGAQQQLVALSVKQRLLGGLIGHDDDKARQLADQLVGDTTAALEDLRDLARGIYPPLLADKGLAAALDSQARKSATPATVTADGIGRFHQDIEAAVYFACLEALQNVAKYARASHASIDLLRRDGHLGFTVTDDGRGFDPSATSYGTGLQGIADRLASLGGTFDVRSSPGGGTSVQGSIPLPTG